MEAMGCREGLALASDLAVRKIRLATDNISVVRNIKSGSKGVYARIVEEIRPKQELSCNTTTGYSGRRPGNSGQNR